MLGNMLAGKRFVKASSGNKKGKGIVRVGSGNKKRERNRESWLWKQNGFLMLPHPLTNFEIQKYYQSKPRFNGVYSRNNLTKK